MRHRIPQHTSVDTVCTCVYNLQIICFFCTIIDVPIINDRGANIYAYAKKYFLFKQKCLPKFFTTTNFLYNNIFILTREDSDFDMSSNPHGIRYSAFNKNIVPSVMQQQQNIKQVPVMMKVPPKPKQYMQQQKMEQNLSESDTDSNENLSKEERYVIKNMARVEPQGQEQGGKKTPVGDSNQGM